jgi:hypothetical protein
VNEFRALILVALFCVVTGCATVTPPKEPPKDPVDVYLNDYGIHSSVILPMDSDGLYVEYAFGDFGYAALNHDSPFDAIGALLFSFKSGFGRQLLRVPPGEKTPTLVYAPNTMTRFTASRSAVDKLVRDLNQRFDGNKGEIVHNDVTQIDWKVDREHYSAINNCNQLTARQLKELGYEVHGLPFFSGFSVKGGEKVKPQAIKNPSKSPGGMSGSR